MPKRSGKGVYTEHQERLWRHDKRRPRRTRVEITQDFGRSIEKQIITFPSYVTVDAKGIPKGRTGEWNAIWRHGIKIVKSAKTGRTFLFDMHGQYLGELEPFDVYHLAVRLLESMDAVTKYVDRRIRTGRTIRYMIKSYRKAVKENH